MDEAVSHESGVPVFFKGDVAFSSLVVERLKIQGFPDDKHYTVYYAGTSMKLKRKKANNKYIFIKEDQTVEGTRSTS